MEESVNSMTQEYSSIIQDGTTLGLCMLIVIAVFFLAICVVILKKMDWH